MNLSCVRVTVVCMYISTLAASVFTPSTNGLFLSGKHGTFVCFVLTFETPPSSIGLEHVYIRYSVSRSEVYTFIPAHQDLSLFSLSVSFSFRFPTTYG